ncbi:MAG: hypothetical protein JO208_07545 [Alphaproteobacteria bacterium]|nr:hypothetical protein [Alphaproteobacteria bacterium]
MPKFGVLLFLALAGCTSMPNPSQRPPPAYVIFFQDDSTAISRQAAFIINRAAVDANHHANKVVEVTGPSTTKTKHYNPSLAGPRIVAVEHALAAAGVEERRIVEASLPPPSLKLKEDATSAQRVEIRMVDRAGS